MTKKNHLATLYLVRSCQVGIVLPEDEESKHGHAVEDPDGEAEEVDQALDVPTKDQGTCNKGLV